MTVAALPGNVRLRAFQLGPETSWATPVAATRRLPWTFTPTVDPHWTFPVADTGTLDEAIAPYRMAIDVTGQATGDLAYNDVPYLMCGLGSSITPSGTTAKTWTSSYASTSQDAFQLFTGEWGDEVAGDQFQYASGTLEKLQLQIPNDLGPWQVQADWRFATVTYPNARTALSVDFAPTWVYGADTSLYIDSTAAGIEATQLLNTMHDATVVITPAIDVKRFANGSNTRFAAQGYGRGARTFEVTFSFAKSTAALAEVANWLNASAQERFVGLKAQSASTIGGTPYSLDLRFAGFWFTRTEGTYATSNTTAQLVCKAFLDQTLAYPFSLTCVNGLTTL